MKYKIIDSTSIHFFFFLKEINMISLTYFDIFVFKSWIELLLLLQSNRKVRLNFLSLTKIIFWNHDFDVPQLFMLALTPFMNDYLSCIVIFLWAFGRERPWFGSNNATPSLTFAHVHFFVFCCYVLILFLLVARLP